MWRVLGPCNPDEMSTANLLPKILLIDWTRDPGKVPTTELIGWWTLTCEITRIDPKLANIGEWNALRPRISSIRSRNKQFNTVFSGINISTRKLIENCQFAGGSRSDVKLNRNRLWREGSSRLLSHVTPAFQSNSWGIKIQKQRC